VGAGGAELHHLEGIVTLDTGCRHIQNERRVNSLRVLRGDHRGRDHRGATCLLRSFPGHDRPSPGNSLHRSPDRISQGRSACLATVPSSDVPEYIRSLSLLQLIVSSRLRTCRTSHRPELSRLSPCTTAGPQVFMKGGFKMIPALRCRCSSR
jgi:hypothetical protein